MREMVLNHASIVSPDSHTAVEWLKDVSTGMAQIVDKGVAESSLRMCRPLFEINCVLGCSLWDVYQELRKNGARDTYGFLMRLSAKHPLLSEVELDFRDRFLACEAKELSPEDGEPLVLCAITDWIAVGFPSAPGWDCDCLTVSFNELLSDDRIEETSRNNRQSHSIRSCFVDLRASPCYPSSLPKSLGIVGAKGRGVPESYFRAGCENRPRFFWAYRQKVNCPRRIGR